MLMYVDGLGLKSNWESLLLQFQVEPRLGKKILFELVRAYCSGERFYHTLGHIQDVLEKVEGMRSHALNFHAIQFAAWFHDAIYDPKARDNEEKSAECAAAILTELEIPLMTIKATIDIILNTQHHQTSPDDIDSHIFLDADLAILGADESEYQFYARGIKREYAWLSELEYRRGRTMVLIKFLQRDRIYFTEQMFAELEEKARQNMRAEIKDLSSDA